MTLKETEKLLKAKGKNEEFIIFHDTETTGVNKTDRILQSAHALYSFNKRSKKIKFIDFLEENIKPPVPIGPASAAVHGIWYPDLEDSPEWKNSISKDFFELFIKEKVFYCAHNSPFDIGQLEKENINYPVELVIDTLKIARHVNMKNEDIESNGLQYLRYFYNFDMNEDFTKFLSDYNIKKLVPHTALSDIAVLAYYFKLLLNEKFISSLEDAIEYTRTPVIEDSMKFGNVFDKGTPFSKVITSTYSQYGKKKRGIDYLNWAISNMDNLSADIKITISKMVINSVKDSKISITDKAIIPMKYIAAAFDKNSREFLNKKGFNVEEAKEKTIQKIKDKISSIESSGEEDSTREYPTLVQLVKYYEYLEE